MKTLRFLHTSDWQLGMASRFLSDDARGRFFQARLDAIRKLGEVCQTYECQFMVVAGDVFEHNQVNRKTVVRALEALKSVNVPVYLLPGNHDYLCKESVYYSSTFQHNKPQHVHVIEDTSLIEICEGVELVGVPWTSKKPTEDILVKAIQDLEPSEKHRICVGHGAVSTLAPNQNAAGVIGLTHVEAALAAGKISYLALGDRHSLTRVGESNRIWYASAPEPTDYNEVKPGYGLVVSLEGDDISTQEVAVGSWKFIEEEIHLNNEQDIKGLEVLLQEQEHKERTLVKLRFIGTLSLTLYDRLQKVLGDFDEVFAALERRERGLEVLSSDTDFESFGFSGFASETVQRLRSYAEASDDRASVAQDALALLCRLAREEQ